MIRRRVLIVNCYPGITRIPLKTSLRGPQPMAPAYLAGVFSDKNCDIQLYDEVASGWLEDEALLGWPDMLVLTGLNSAFDRFLHLTAYARTKNSNVIVVAGGGAIKMLKHYVHRNNYFDYACTGDIEQIAEVIQDAWGRVYLSNEFLEHGWAIPRYDLIYKFGHPAYLEASRSCYYKCNFCSLTAESAPYVSYGIDYIHAQIRALKGKKNIVFIDNNFYTRKTGHLDARFNLLEELYSQGVINQWSALVTDDFFYDSNLLTRARKTGCVALFSGVESFDQSTLMSYNKKQNTTINQFEMIHRCLEAGIGFFYGLVYNPSIRTIAEIDAELNMILDAKNIPLPSYIGLAIPMLGTPMFYDALRNKKVLPNVNIRDLDSTTITLKTIDPIEDVVRFVKGIQNKERFMHALQHNIVFFAKHWKMPSNTLLYMLLTSTMGETKISRFIKSPSSVKWWKHKRTYIAGKEQLDKFYAPFIRVDRRYQGYFRPTKLTDDKGYLADGLMEDFPLDQ